MGAGRSRAATPVLISRGVDRLLDEAARTSTEGWDFRRLGRRITTAEPWDYTDFVAEVTVDVRTLVDLGTGGGEWLSTYDARPALTVASESWPPNVPVAHRRLAPLGIPVVHTEPCPDNMPPPPTAAGRLPFRDGAFDAVLSRHESFNAAEVARVLRPGGVFVTQQVSSDTYAAVRDLVGAPSGDDPGWHLPAAVAQLSAAGLTMEHETTGAAETMFADIGALAWWLRAIPWAVPGFSIERFRDRLLELHDEAPITVLEPRFRLVARKP